VPGALTRPPPRSLSQAAQSAHQVPGCAVGPARHYRPAR